MNPKKLKTGEIKDLLIKEIEEIAKKYSVTNPIPKFSGTTFTVKGIKNTLRVRKIHEYQGSKTYVLNVEIQDKQLYPEDHAIVLEYFKAIDNFWNIYGFKTSYKGHVYVTGVDSPFREVESQIKECFRNYYYNEIKEKGSFEGELEYHEYMYFIGKAVRKKYQVYLGGRMGEDLRKRAIGYGNFYPALKELFIAVPIINTKKDEELEDLIVDDFGVGIKCGSSEIILHKEFETHPSMYRHSVKIDYEQLEIRYADEGRLKSKNIKVFDSKTGTHISEELIEIFNEVLERDKLKNLIERPKYKFTELVKQSVRFFSDFIYMEGITDIEEAFDSYVEVCDDDWAKAETLASYFIDEEPVYKEIISVVNTKIGLIQYKKRNQEINLIFKKYMNQLIVSINENNISVKDDKDKIIERYVQENMTSNK